MASVQTYSETQGLGLHLPLGLIEHVTINAALPLLVDRRHRMPRKKRRGFSDAAKRRDVPSEVPHVCSEGTTMRWMRLGPPEPKVIQEIEVMLEWPEREVSRLRLSLVS